MCKIQDLPVEVWDVIITLACTDGGYTGLSLTLTSRFFHAQSLSARYNSLAFSSITRIEGFLAFISRQPSQCKPKIAHLFLYFEEPENKPLSPSWNYSSILLREEREIWGERYSAARAALLTLASPSLLTICLIEDENFPLPISSCQKLPKCEEMTILHYNNAFLPIQVHCPFPEMTIRDKLPSLRRLHRVCTPSISIPDLLIALAMLAPQSLTHLRISAVTSHTPGYRDIPSALNQALRASGEVDGGGSPFSHAIPSLRHVLVHGYAPPSCATALHKEGWAEFANELRSLEERCTEEGRVHFSWTERPWQRRPRWLDRLRSEWLDRMQGGKGVWATTEEEETALEMPEDGVDEGHVPYHQPVTSTAHSVVFGLPRSASAG